MPYLSIQYVLIDVRNKTMSRTQLLFLERSSVYACFLRSIWQSVDQLAASFGIERTTVVDAEEKSRRMERQVLP